ncbi:hypothetical protein HDU67_003988 [Dinochytrium kinnereticum]|nr:hypothetical protein HDU67_003988 [Dinochytrium kinnereticum]
MHIDHAYHASAHMPLMTDDGEEDEDEEDDEEEEDDDEGDFYPTHHHWSIRNKQQQHLASLGLILCQPGEPQLVVEALFVPLDEDDIAVAQEELPPRKSSLAWTLVNPTRTPPPYPPSGLMHDPVLSLHSGSPLQQQQRWPFRHDSGNMSSSSTNSNTTRSGAGGNYTISTGSRSSFNPASMAETAEEKEEEETAPPPPTLEALLYLQNTFPAPLGYLEYSSPSLEEMLQSNGGVDPLMQSGLLDSTQGRLQAATLSAGDDGLRDTDIDKWTTPSPAPSPSPSSVGDKQFTAEAPLIVPPPRSSSVPAAGLKASTTTSTPSLTKDPDVPAAILSPLIIPANPNLDLSGATRYPGGIDYQRIEEGRWVTRTLPHPKSNRAAADGEDDQVEKRVIVQPSAPTSSMAAVFASAVITSTQTHQEAFDPLDPRNIKEKLKTGFRRLIRVKSLPDLESLSSSSSGGLDDALVWEPTFRPSVDDLDFLLPKEEERFRDQRAVFKPKPPSRRPLSPIDSNVARRPLSPVEGITKHPFPPDPSFAKRPLSPVDSGGLRVVEIIAGGVEVVSPRPPSPGLYYGEPQTAIKVSAPAPVVRTSFFPDKTQTPAPVPNAIRLTTNSQPPKNSFRDRAGTFLNGKKKNVPPASEDMDGGVKSSTSFSTITLVEDEDDDDSPYAMQRAVLRVRPRRPSAPDLSTPSPRMEISAPKSVTASLGQTTLVRRGEPVGIVAPYPSVFPLAGRPAAHLVGSSSEVPIATYAVSSTTSQYGMTTPTSVTSVIVPSPASQRGNVGAGMLATPTSAESYIAPSPISGRATGASSLPTPTSPSQSRRPSGGTGLPALGSPSNKPRRPSGGLSELRGLDDFSSLPAPPLDAVAPPLLETTPLTRQTVLEILAKVENSGSIPTPVIHRTATPVPPFDITAVIPARDHSLPIGGCPAVRIPSRSQSLAIAVHHQNDATAATMWMDDEMPPPPPPPHILASIQAANASLSRPVKFIEEATPMPGMSGDRMQPQGILKQDTLTTGRKPSLKNGGERFGEGRRPSVETGMASLGRRVTGGARKGSVGGEEGGVIQGGKGAVSGFGIETFI